MSDLIRRDEAIDVVYERIRQIGYEHNQSVRSIIQAIRDLPSAQSEEVIPHRNYKYLSDYWCECGWHLGKKGEVKYCSECGRKVNWDE